MSIFAFAAALVSAAMPPEPIDPAGWVDPSDYPPAAVEREIEGTVGFRLQVDEAGKVTGCEVTDPADPILDEATCRQMMLRARFRPALGQDGAPIPSSFSSRVAWRVPDGAAPVVPPFETFVAGASIMELIFSIPQGAGADCRHRTIGPAPIGLSVSPCATFWSGRNTLLGESAPNHGQITLRVALRTDGQEPAALPLAEGEAVVRRQRAFRFAANGELVECEPVGDDLEPRPGFFREGPPLCEVVERLTRPWPEGRTEPLVGTLRLEIHYQPGGD